MGACNSALSANAGKTRHYINVVCCSLLIEDPAVELSPGSMRWPPGVNTDGYIVRSLPPYAPRLLGLRSPPPHPHFSVAPFQLGIWTGPFLVGDMDWPLSGWGSGPAPFQLGIWTVKTINNLLLCCIFASCYVELRPRISTLRCCPYMHHVFLRFFSQVLHRVVPLAKILPARTVPKPKPVCAWSQALPFLGRSVESSKEPLLVSGPSLPFLEMFGEEACASVV